MEDTTLRDITLLGNPLKIFNQFIIFLKEAVLVVSNDPPCKYGNARFTTIPFV
jgi:hypothetical protein